MCWVCTVPGRTHPRGGRIPVGRGLRTKLLLPTTRQPLASSLPAKDRDARSVGGSGARAGDQTGQNRRPNTSGHCRVAASNWQSLQHTTLGLVVLGSKDRLELQESGASRRRGTTFPRRPAEVGVTGKAPRPAALPQRNGAGFGGEWLPRGSRVVPPVVVPRLRESGDPGAELMCSSLAGPDCCGGLDNIDFRQADLCVMNWLVGYVDPSDPYFVAAVLTIAFNPLFWNVVARWEQKTRKLSRAFGSPYLACYALGGAILLLNVLRSHCFTQAMLSQPRMHSLDNPTAYLVGLALLLVGGVLVLSSFFALGFTGTFLGDYFGILKEARVTTFPFNILDNPMYWGSTANYLGWAVMHASPAGLGLTAVVALVYVVAILYEEPFTAEIYRQKSSQLRKRS